MTQHSSPSPFQLEAQQPAAFQDQDTVASGQAGAPIQSEGSLDAPLGQAVPPLRPLSVSNQQVGASMKQQQQPQGKLSVAMPPLRTTNGSQPRQGGPSQQSQSTGRAETKPRPNGGQKNGSAQNTGASGPLDMLGRSSSASRPGTSRASAPGEAGPSRPGGSTQRGQPGARPGIARQNSVTHTLQRAPTAERGLDIPILLWEGKVQLSPTLKRSFSLQNKQGVNELDAGFQMHAKASYPHPYAVDTYGQLPKRADLHLMKLHEAPEDIQNAAAHYISDGQIDKTCPIWRLSVTIGKQLAGFNTLIETLHNKLLDFSIRHAAIEASRAATESERILGKGQLGTDPKAGKYQETKKAAIPVAVDAEQEQEEAAGGGESSSGSKAQAGAGLCSEEDKQKHEVHQRLVAQESRCLDQVRRNAYIVRADFTTGTHKQHMYLLPIIEQKPNAAHNPAAFVVDQKGFLCLSTCRELVQAQAAWERDAQPQKPILRRMSFSFDEPLDSPPKPQPAEGAQMKRRVSFTKSLPGQLETAGSSGLSTLNMTPMTSPPTTTTTTNNNNNNNNVNNSNINNNVNIVNKKVSSTVTPSIPPPIKRPVPNLSAPPTKRPRVATAAAEAAPGSSGSSAVAVVPGSGGGGGSRGGGGGGSQGGQTADVEMEEVEDEDVHVDDDDDEHQQEQEGGDAGMQEGVEDDEEEEQGGGGGGGGSGAVRGDTEAAAGEPDSLPVPLPHPCINIHKMAVDCLAIRAGLEWSQPLKDIMSQKRAGRPVTVGRVLSVRVTDTSPTNYTPTPASPSPWSSWKSLSLPPLPPSSVRDVNVEELAGLLVQKSADGRDSYTSLLALAPRPAPAAKDTAAAAGTDDVMIDGGDGGGGSGGDGDAETQPAQGAGGNQGAGAKAAAARADGDVEMSDATQAEDGSDRGAVAAEPAGAAAMQQGGGEQAAGGGGGDGAAAQGPDTFTFDVPPSVQVTPATPLAVQLSVEGKGKAQGEGKAGDGSGPTTSGAAAAAAGSKPASSTAPTATEPPPPPAAGAAAECSGSDAAVLPLQRSSSGGGAGKAGGPPETVLGLPARWQCYSNMLHRTVTNPDELDKLRGMCDVQNNIKQKQLKDVRVLYLHSSPAEPPQAGVLRSRGLSVTCSRADNWHHQPTDFDLVLVPDTKQELLPFQELPTMQAKVHHSFLPLRVFQLSPCLLLKSDHFINKSNFLSTAKTPAENTAMTLQRFLETAKLAPTWSLGAAILMDANTWVHCDQQKLSQLLMVLKVAQALQPDFWHVLMRPAHMDYVMQWGDDQVVALLVEAYEAGLVRPLSRVASTATTRFTIVTIPDIPQPPPATDKAAGPTAASERVPGQQQQGTCGDVAHKYVAELTASVDRQGWLLHGTITDIQTLVQALVQLV